MVEEQRAAGNDSRVSRACSSGGTCAPERRGGGEARNVVAVAAAAADAKDGDEGGGRPKTELLKQRSSSARESGAAGVLTVVIAVVEDGCAPPTDDSENDGGGGTAKDGPVNRPLVRDRGTRSGVVLWLWRLMLSLLSRLRRRALCTGEKESAPARASEDVAAVPHVSRVPETEGDRFNENDAARLVRRGRRRGARPLWRRYALLPPLMLRLR